MLRDRQCFARLRNRSFSYLNVERARCKFTYRFAATVLCDRGMKMRRAAKKWIGTRCGQMNKLLCSFPRSERFGFPPSGEGGYVEKEEANAIMLTDCSELCWNKTVFGEPVFVSLLAC